MLTLAELRYCKDLYSANSDYFHILKGFNTELHKKIHRTSLPILWFKKLHKGTNMFLEPRRLTLY